MAEATVLCMYSIPPHLSTLVRFFQKPVLLVTFYEADILATLHDTFIFNADRKEDLAIKIRYRKAVSL